MTSHSNTKPADIAVNDLQSFRQEWRKEQKRQRYESFCSFLLLFFTAIASSIATYLLLQQQTIPLPRVKDEQLPPVVQSCSTKYSVRPPSPACIACQNFVDQTTAATTSTKKPIILFGDSITQGSFSISGFGAYISNVYARRLDVLNRGFSGYNTRWAKKYIKDIFPPTSKASLITIFFGANDASIIELNPRHHVPIQEYGRNLADLCNHVKEMCNGRIILVTNPPVAHFKRLEFQKQKYGKGATGILERTNEVAGLYAAKCVEVAKANQYPVLDLWTLMQEEEDWPSFLNDGLHFSEKGNQFVGRLMVDAINKYYPELAVTPCPFSGSFHNSGSTSKIKHFLPWHKNIDETSYVEYQDVMKKVNSGSAPPPPPPLPLLPPLLLLLLLLRHLRVFPAPQQLLKCQPKQLHLKQH
jgi:isoamyl acetate esterase